ncbi:MAG: 2,3-bisphosphoglycerate-independent phosphoglycerate mutase [Bacteroidales bacterium]|nr:2,3-bisphosphoglycerate-independent phosphoglycerate mutase [Bacteroidales bacterium]
MSKKSILIIMDGWGEGNKTRSDVIANANTPYVDSLYENKDVARAYLRTSGEYVGLPEGQMGNSEVGHLNLGAGRVVYQDLVRINKAVKENTIEDNEKLNEAFQYAKDNNKQVHFLGLVSDGGVHASTKHLMKLVEMASERDLEKVFVHVLTDGRDTDPKSGHGYVKELNDFIKNTSGEIASICGRYYTMDRDKRWDRIKRGYDLLLKGEGEQYTDPLTAIADSYEKGVTDEFIEPKVMVDDNGNPKTTVQEGDVFICFNFRTDRLRQITRVLTQEDMPGHGMQTVPLEYYTMTRYDESFKDINIIFDKQEIPNTMGEYLASLGKTQLRIAETEKYAHVTFFFNGGEEKKFEGEDRILIDSPQEVPTYDHKPSMSAFAVKDAVVKEIKRNHYDFIVLNFANPDMVGHTGVYEAIVEAVETVDQCVKEVTEAALEQDYSILITADHGNADNAVNEDGSPNTAHSTNPVPLFLLDKDYKAIKPGKLADVSPTLLKVMQIDIPKEMTGEVLVD